MIGIDDTSTVGASDRRPVDDRGLGAVWLAIGLSIFMSFAAMAVDIGLWYSERTEVQTAADSAALAGAALLPGDPTQAADQARLVARQHGYRNDQVDVNIIDGSLIEVFIQAEVDNYFLPAIGFGDTQLIGANAVAEYEGQVNMGSPENAIGNDPESGGTQPDFTLGVEGPGYTKINGDRFLPRNCGGSAVSNCVVGGTPQENLEYDPNGYFFAVEVEATHGQDLVFEVFDPAYVAGYLNWSAGGVSFNGECEYLNPYPAQRTALRNLTLSGTYTGYDGGTIPQGWYDNADTRYQWGRGLWCLGDANSSGPNLLDTAFTIRSPDDTPWNPLDNRTITQAQCMPAMFEGYGLDYNWNSVTSAGSDGALPNGYELLDPTNTTFRNRGEWKVDLTDDDWTLAEVWRRWVPICRIPAAFVETGKYLIQVRTTASVSNPQAYDPAKNESGLNAFSIRAGFDNGTATLQTYNDVRVFAEGNLPIFANADAANPTFHLARILEVNRDRTLTVELYDAGDAGSAGYIRVLPPADSNMTTFSGCVFDLDGTGTPPNTLPNSCRVNGVSSANGFNGKVMLIQVPIPASYQCDESLPTGCWVKLEMGFSDVHDFTTWSAYISGDPVRLVE